jgi:hypothetical protein
MNIKSGCFLLMLGIFFSLASNAQHCPFDGSYTIAIHIKSQGILESLPTFYLVEQEESLQDSCRFNSRIDSIRFLTEDEVRRRLEADPQSTRSRYLPEWLSRDFNFLKGNQVVLLSMSQKDCMVPMGNNYQFIPRVFVVRFTVNGLAKELPVPQESVYSLCGSAGSWKRIRPIEIKLE